MILYAEWVPWHQLTIGDLYTYESVNHNSDNYGDVDRPANAPRSSADPKVYLYLGHPHPAARRRRKGVFRVRLGSRAERIANTIVQSIYADVQLIRGPTLMPLRQLIVDQVRQALREIGDVESMPQADAPSL